MLQSVHIQNFKCLKDVVVEFEPLTVLVGPNASGKSAILDALSRPRTSREDHWTFARDIKVRRDFHWGQPEEDSESRGEFGMGRFPEVQMLQLDPTAMRGSNTVAHAMRLDRSGINLVNVFYTLGRATQSRIARQLSSLVPVVQDVDTLPQGSGSHELRFQDRWNDQVWFQPKQVSDGTMLVLAFLVLQNQKGAVDMIAVEEPERGLHPYLLGRVIELFRGLATGKVGDRPVQVVLATQSAELLDHVRPEEVRFLSRNSEDGSVNVESAPTDSPDWAQAYREYQESLGGVWLSGSLGGVPGT